MENERLKQQLAEKEKKFQKWASGYFASPTNQPVLTTSQHLTQDKIHFAIEQLEKVKEYIHGKYLDETWHNKIVDEDREDIHDFIDQQIKELKG